MSDVATPVDGSDTPRSSRWRAPAVVFGVVVLALAALGLGVALGRASAPGPDIVVAPGPVVEESPEAERLPEANELTPAPAASAAPEGVPPVTTVVSTTLPDWPATFESAPGLPDDPTTASGYRMVREGISGAQVAGVLGSALGTVGQPVADSGTWTVGPADGSGPRLTVNDDPLVSWSFEDPTAPTEAVGPPMSADRALELATALLGSIGVDTATVDWQVDRYDGVTAVTAWQLAGGARTQLAWQVGFSPSGAVAAASGFSAGLEEVPGYPVIGAASAVRRAALPAWAVIGPTPVFAAAPAATEPASPSPSPSTPPVPSSDRPPLVVGVSAVTISGADLSLAQFWQPDGSLIVLPAYALTGEDGSRWSLLAVEDAFVQFVDQPYPSVDPAA